ncbi:enediyne antibiotic chromoprotein [Micromonospora arborensis]|uniref:enediyne antibiotic chromoprotein n=1 Tax=Micromonospora arborensis TaxID=2116518 RepID=UPI0033C751F8
MNRKPTTVRTVLSAGGFALTLGLVAVGTASPALAAQNPSITATPATGLTDGQLVSVTTSDYPANSGVIAAQCALPEPGVQVCDWANAAFFGTDDSGEGTSSLVVRVTFDGNTPDGQPYGSIDCSTVAGGCLIGAIDTGYTTETATPISFG